MTYSNSQYATGNFLQRTLRLSGAEERVVYVRISYPIIDGNHCFCGYEISGLQQKVKGKSFGVDGIQAVLYAINSVGSALYFCDEYREGFLTWDLGGNATYLGFPVPKPIADLVPDFE